LGQFRVVFLDTRITRPELPERPGLDFSIDYLNFHVEIEETLSYGKLRIEVLMAVAVGVDFDGDLGSSAFLCWIRWQMDCFFSPFFDPDHGRLERMKRQ